MESTPAPAKEVLTYSVVLPTGPFTGNEKIVVQVAEGQNITIPLKNLPGFKPGGKVTIKQNVKDKKITVNYDKIPAKKPTGNNPTASVTKAPEIAKKQVNEGAVKPAGNQISVPKTPGNEKVLVLPPKSVTTPVAGTPKTIIRKGVAPTAGQADVESPKVVFLTPGQPGAATPLNDQLKSQIITKQPRKILPAVEVNEAIRKLATKRVYPGNSEESQSQAKENAPVPAKKKAVEAKPKSKQTGSGQCSVRGCFNTFGRYIDRIPFPVEDPERCMKWLDLTDNTKARDLFESQDPEFENLALCEYHFLERDFKPTYPRKLKDDVIPSVFGPDAVEMKEQITIMKKKIENASKKAFPNEYLPKTDLQGRKIVYWPMDVPIPIDPDNPPDPNRKRTIGSIYPNGKPFILNTTGNPLKMLQKQTETDQLRKQLEAEQALSKSYLKILQENGIDSTGKYVANAPGQEILTLKQRIVSLNLTIKKHENTQRELRREITILRNIEKSHAMCKKTINQLQTQVNQLKTYQAASNEGESALPNSKAQIRIRNLEAQNTMLKKMLEAELKRNNKKLVVKLKKIPRGGQPQSAFMQDPLSLDQMDLSVEGHPVVYEPQVMMHHESQEVYQEGQVVYQEHEVVHEDGGHVQMEHEIEEGEEVDLVEEGDSEEIIIKEEVQTMVNQGSEDSTEEVSVNDGHVEDSEAGESAAE